MNFATSTEGPQTISQVSRRNIADEISLSNISWAGRFDEHEFLARLYNLKEMHSTDGRYKDASGDIWKHRVVNSDWSHDWVFYDARFNLLNESDERFLNFLCETIHPVARPSEDEARQLLEIYNRNLAPDGWEIAQRTEISGRPVYAARKKLVDGSPLIEGAKQIAQSVNAEYIMGQITRMESTIQSSPDLAIGTAKEFLETICKTVLRARGIPYDNNDDLPGLVRACLTNMSLVPEGVQNPSSAREAIKSLVGNLVGVSGRIGNIRSEFGTGHGKEAGYQGLEASHARLVVGAAVTIGVFIFESHAKNRAP